MGWFDGKSHEEEIVEKAHNEGQKDGSEDVGFWREVHTETAYRLFDGNDAADAYRSGLENGKENRPKD